MAGYATVAVAW